VRRSARRNSRSPRTAIRTPTRIRSGCNADTRSGLQRHQLVRRLTNTSAVPGVGFEPTLPLREGGSGPQPPRAAEVHRHPPPVQRRDSSVRTRRSRSEIAA
jgi:hypothetical protein